MKLQRGGYAAALRKGDVLDVRAVNLLLEELRSHLHVEPVPIEVCVRSESQPKITDALSQLQLRLARGPRSWGGLVVGFPGSNRQLTTEAVGTPYLRKILYPIVDLSRRLQNFTGLRLPCIYLVGQRFPDVFLRKFALLERMSPHVVVLTAGLLRAKDAAIPRPTERDDEARVQGHLCQTMASQSGLHVPFGGRSLKLGYLASELPTGEGTKNPERLDMLGFDRADHSLVAFEIKGPTCGRVDLENLFLQGFEHRDWLERHKMAIKFVFDGPRGTRVNARKRVRLILGCFQKDVPPLFRELRRQALRKDRHLEIGFVRFSYAAGPSGDLTIAEANGN